MITSIATAVTWPAMGEPNFTFEQAAGSHALAAAGQRECLAHWQDDLPGPIEGHRQVDRRIFLATVGWSFLAAPIVVEAQSAAKGPRVGVIRGLAMLTPAAQRARWLARPMARK
jgi:hypothetical protein